MTKREKILVALLERSGPKLHTLLTRLMRDEHAAEDLMQDLFCRLCNVNDLSKIKNLQAYARQVAIHLAYDRLRAQKRNPLPLALADTANIAGLPSEALGPDQYEQLTMILDAATQLEGLMWECFVMRYIEQMEYGKIADGLGKTPHQVRALCSKGIRKIRGLVNRQPNCPSVKEVPNG